VVLPVWPAAIAGIEASSANALGPRLLVSNILKGAPQLGRVDVEIDADGFVRSAYLRAGIKGPTWPALGLALLNGQPGGSGRYLQGERAASMPSDSPGFVRYEAGRRVVPRSDRAGRFHVALFAE
jgi:hypothetical protein